MLSPSRQEDPRIRGGRRVVRCASSHLLRLFPSAALPHPPLRLFFSYSGGSRGVAEGKGAQQTRARTGPRSSLCTGSPPHSPLPPHRPRPSRRGRERPGDSERRPARIFPPPPCGPRHHHTPARTPMRKAQYRGPGTSVSPSHRNRWLSGQDRRDGEGRMGAGVDVARTGAAPTADPVHTGTPCGRGAHRSRTPRFAPDSSAPSRRSWPVRGLPGEKGSLSPLHPDNVPESIVCSISIWSPEYRKGP